MSENRDSFKHTVIFSLVLCFAFSLLVSSAAVLLKPAQKKNKEDYRKQNILAAAGLLVPGKSIDEQFASISTKLINLETGEYVESIDIEAFDQLKAAKSAEAKRLGKQEDIAAIKSREPYSLVYLLVKDGQTERIILPIRGYGLWGTLFGYLALEGDANTVAGIGFYDHKETPGLGGEVDNPNWKAQWLGKKIFDEDFTQPKLALVKGGVNIGSAEASYQIDSLSGATLTSRGVTNLIQYWLGQDGFGPFLNRIRQG